MTIIVPVFNEEATIVTVVRRLRELPYPTQLVVVDDGSTDRTVELLRSMRDNAFLEICTHLVNRGKCAAVRTGMGQARGDIVVIQDADLEYSPTDIPALIDPIVNGEWDVVFGSRFTGSHPSARHAHATGNRLLTALCNALFRSSLTDLETGYKAMRSEVASAIHLRSQRWGFDPEITAKILKAGYTIHEVPISYSSRSVLEGKKIRRRDGFAVAAALVRYRFVN